MTNSLRAKISKLRHDRNITEEEYQELISKLDGHDKQIKAEAIDEFTIDIINRINFEDKWLFICKSNNADTNIMFSALRNFVKNRAEQLKEQSNKQYLCPEGYDKRIVSCDKCEIPFCDYR